MTVSGNVARRAPYAPLIPEWGHIAPCFCHHCPFNKTFPECELACAEDLETFVREHQTETAAGFIFEPVVGATLGAAVPPEGYVAHIAATCRRNGILLIADEVMTGMGRTGKPFAVQHWGVEPDIILVGKGVPAVTRRSARFSFPRASSRHSNGARAPSCTASLIKRMQYPPPRATLFSIISNRTNFLIA